VNLGISEGVARGCKIGAGYISLALILHCSRVNLVLSEGVVRGCKIGAGYQPCSESAQQPIERDVSDPGCYSSEELKCARMRPTGCCSRRCTNALTSGMSAVQMQSSGTQPKKTNVQEREVLFESSQQRIRYFAAENGCRLLHTPGNPISMAMTLEGLSQRECQPLDRTAGARNAAAHTRGTPTSTAAREAGGAPSSSTDVEGDGSPESPENHSSARRNLGTAAVSDAEGSEMGLPPEGVFGPTTAMQERLRDPDSPQQLGGVGDREDGHAGVPGDSGVDAVTPRSNLPVTFLGSMLFHRCVSGTRVVGRGKVQAVEGITFQGYGAHCEAYPHDYITVAAAVGTTEGDIDRFLGRLRKCFVEFRKKENK